MDEKLDAGNEPEKSDEHRPVEEDCSDEKCEGCGEKHPVLDLDKFALRQKREFRFFGGLYLLALLGVDWCVYEIFGFWTAGAVFFCYLTYFFHMNMLRAQSTLNGIARFSQQIATGQLPGMDQLPGMGQMPGMSQMPGMGQMPPPPRPSAQGEEEEFGQYV